MCIHIHIYIYIYIYIYTYIHHALSPQSDRRDSCSAVQCVAECYSEVQSISSQFVAVRRNVLRVRILLCTATHV